ncbi:MAG: DUF885 family protein [Candidatus Nanopelagicales bacterium]
MSLKEAVDKLGIEFWNWRMKQQPRSHDDIPRLERVENWLPAWSESDIATYRVALKEFQARYESIEFINFDDTAFDKETYVDYRLIGSAISRVYWELDHLKSWQEQPRFYIDQTIGVVFDLLLAPEVTDKRISEVALVLANSPQILQDGLANLSGNSVREYAIVAIELLGNIEVEVNRMVEELASFAEPSTVNSLKLAGDRAIAAFVNFREWLESNQKDMKQIQPVGRNKYQWFFDHVALVPYQPEELIAIGNLEWERAVTLEHITANKYRDVENVSIPSSVTKQVENERNAELQVRSFYDEESILSQPNSLKHYLNGALPAYLEPIQWLGVTDDLTGPSRVEENGISYVPEPHNELPYFYAANARDTRAGIVHEGAHYQQLALSWRNERPLRRFYYDSGVNEGIAFYNEELMLAAGLFEDVPHSKIVMYNFMKLRAMRVIVDVQLATGSIDIETATSYLENKVPMDRATAYEEAVSFASSPGQALTYQIGKTQIIKLFSDSIEKHGRKFSMRHFHDYLWYNGNVPLSLLRFEYLDDRSELDAIDIRKS